jgi:hypothetical protein
MDCGTVMYYWIVLEEYIGWKLEQVYMRIAEGFAEALQHLQTLMFHKSFGCQRCRVGQILRMSGVT